MFFRETHIIQTDTQEGTEGSASEEGSGDDSEESGSESGSGSSESDSGSDSEADVEDSGDEYDVDLLYAARNQFQYLTRYKRAPGSMYKRLESLCNKLLTEGFPSLDVMQKAVRRHKVKFMESLEDDPQDYLSELIIPDILFSKTGS